MLSTEPCPQGRVGRFGHHRVTKCLLRKLTVYLATVACFTSRVGPRDLALSPHFQTPTVWYHQGVVAQALSSQHSDSPAAVPTVKLWPC